MQQHYLCYKIYKIHLVCDNKHLDMFKVFSFLLMQMIDTKALIVKLDIRASKYVINIVQSIENGVNVS